MGKRRDSKRNFVVDGHGTLREKPVPAPIAPIEPYNKDQNKNWYSKGSPLNRTPIGYGPYGQPIYRKEFQSKEQIKADLKIKIRSLINEAANTPFKKWRAGLIEQLKEYCSYEEIKRLSRGMKGD